MSRRPNVILAFGNAAAQTRKETREDKLRDEESLYRAAQEFAQVATEILTETIDAKGVFNILSDWYNN